MPTVPVRLGVRSYAIEISPRILAELGERTRAVLGPNARRAVVVSNPTVDRIYGASVARSLARADFKTHRFLIGDGERFKTLRTAQSLYAFLIEHRVERSDSIVALGGGVIGDLAGFAAATYLRGVRLIQVPTTLLAQIDSSVGGKTAVNHQLGKNLIGSFHQPSLVLIDPETLNSLPTREIHAGLCEAIKYGVILDRQLFNFIARDIDRLNSLEPSRISELIASCCQIKARVVRSDERETGLRRILNFGHTVGHALEAATRYRRFLHGEAVGIGMCAASRIAERMDLLKVADRQRIEAAISSVGKRPDTKSIAVDDIISAMNRDKKVEGGRISFVLPVEIGRVVIRSDVPSQTVRAALTDILR